MRELFNEYKKGKGKFKYGVHNKKQNMRKNKEIYNKKHVRITLFKISNK